MSRFVKQKRGTFVSISQRDTTVIRSFQQRGLTNQYHYWAYTFDIEFIDRTCVWDSIVHWTAHYCRAPYPFNKNVKCSFLVRYRKVTQHKSEGFEGLLLCRSRNEELSSNGRYRSRHQSYWSCYCFCCTRSVKGHRYTYGTTTTDKNATSDRSIET